MNIFLYVYLKIINNIIRGIASKIITIFFMSISLNAHSDDLDDKRFNHLTELDNLSNDYVTKIFKDSKGYMWIGTWAGVNRFDGYEVKPINVADENIIKTSEMYVHDIIEDDKNNIWIGTVLGLYKFDMKYELLTRLNFVENGMKLSGTRVTTLILDDNTLWLGTDGGLDKLNIQTGVVENIFESDRIYSGYGDDNNLWLGTIDRLLRINKISGNINAYPLSNKVEVWDILYDNNVLWLGTKEGVYSFDLSTNSFSIDYNLIGKDVRSLESDKKGNLYISTRKEGLLIYSINGKEIKKSFYNSQDRFALPSSYTRSLYIDNDDMLWVGSLMGLSFTTLSRSVNFMRSSSGKVTSNVIYGVSDDFSGSLWITAYNGITRYSKDNIHHYNSAGANKLAVLESGVFVQIGKKLFKYNSVVDDFEDYSIYIPELKSGVEDVSNLKKYNGHTLIITLSDGVILWDERKKESTYFQLEVDDESISIIYSELFKDDVFVVANRGLFFLDFESKNIKKYLYTPNNKNLNEVTKHSVLMDNNENIWMSTSSGLYKLKNNKLIAHYTDLHGLASNFIQVVYENNNILWVATNKGMQAFDISNDKFNEIHLNNHHFNISYNNSNIYQSDNGQLYFSSPEGVVYFNPEEFTDISVPPKTIITEFHLFNQLVKPGTDLLAESLSSIDQLILDSTENMLTFHFSSMNYRNPKHLYAYQLEGLDNYEEWIITDYKNRQATFTPPPGDYIFRVKSGWDNSTWSDKITELKVTILPPWWQTNWAYTIYVIFTLITLFMIYQIRTRSMRLRSIELESQVEERTIEVQAQKETIEELMDKKNEMFANISHELRTPITLIKGPISQVLSEYPGLQSLVLAERNAQRLSFLVDQLLQLSRMYDFPDESKHTQSLSLIAEAIAASFQSISASQHLTFIIQIEPDIYVSALPNALDTLLINLISNAFKYTEKDGQIILTISKTNSIASITVKDTGIGMPEDKLQNIFDRFTRIESEMSKKVQGVGVGLALVKQLVALHKGEIKVNSKLGVGTEFIVELGATEKPEELLFNDQTLAQDSLKQINYLESQFQASHQEAAKSQIVQLDNTIQTQLVTKPKLLIIDDTDDMREYLESLLSTQYQCFLACDGEEGIAIAKKEIPDIIISDVMMPGISGFEVLDRLREDLLTSHIPILLLTAKGDIESKILGLSKLADDYITKPFDAEELKARINGILVIRQLQQQTLQQLVSKNTADDEEWEELDINLKEKEFLDKLNNVMEDNYQYEEFTVIELADKVHVSGRTLQYKVKGLLGKSPNEYIRECRLNKAKELMLTTNVNISILAEKVGFNNPSYFHKCFKAYVGCTPKQFIQSKNLS